MPPARPPGGRARPKGTVAAAGHGRGGGAGGRLRGRDLGRDVGRQIGRVPRLVLLLRELACRGHRASGAAPRWSAPAARPPAAIAGKPASSRWLLNQSPEPERPRLFSMDQRKIPSHSPKLRGPLVVIGRGRRGPAIVLEPAGLAGHPAPLRIPRLRDPGGLPVLGLILRRLVLDRGRRVFALPAEGVLLFAIRAERVAGPLLGEAAVPRGLTAESAAGPAAGRTAVAPAAEGRRALSFRRRRMGCGNSRSCWGANTHHSTGPRASDVTPGAIEQP